MINRIKNIKKELGSDLLILAHHYQADEIVKLADAVGDSLKLAQIAEKNKTAKYIVFCGVHFMAETADILTEDYQTVIMPDKKAGCPMADMATKAQTEKAWEALTKIFGDTIVPITYINSKAEVKAFCGNHSGTTVTSSNAKKVVTWGLEQKEHMLFLPDQNLGRNTAFSLGIPLDKMALWNPITEKLEFNGTVKDIKVILWKGYCHAHHNISIENLKKVKAEKENIKIIVHPECTHEVVQASDFNGSTEYIINQVKNSENGTKWAIGTETNLVSRLKDAYPEKEIMLLDNVSKCIDMNLTNVQSLFEALESIIQKDIKNKITVDKEIAEGAKKALNLMLSLS